MTTIPHTTTRQQSQVPPGVVRVRLTEALLPSDHADGLVIVWNGTTLANTSLVITVHETTGSYRASAGSLVYAAKFTDSGYYEVISGVGIRLWRFTLNAAFSGSPPTAAADLLEMDGTDTTTDITLYDYLSIFAADLTTGDAGYCIEQYGIYIAIQAPCP